MFRSTLLFSSTLLLRIVAIISALFLLQQLLCYRALSSAWHVFGRLSSLDAHSSCHTLEGLDGILVVLKTGANEIPEKLPVHLDTTLRCVPNHVILSDLEDNFAGNHIYDVLNDTDVRIRETHPDFAHYRRLQDRGRDSFSAAELAQWAAAQNTGSGRDSPAWKLDKWKFLPMAEKALDIMPEAEWYVFMEADTYIIWQTLLAWLSHFDATKPYYLGNQMQIGDIVFAYGGAGFVISNPALKAVVDHYKSNLEAWNNYTASHWAGDCVLGKAMRDSGTPLFWSWPTMASEQPSDMDFNNSFGGSPKSLWCHHATTYHHLSPNELARMHLFEETWSKKSNATFLRHGDIFRHYILPELGPERADWDNLSDVEAAQQATDGTLDNCRRACGRQSHCVQFSISSSRLNSTSSCKTSSVIRLGREREPGNTSRISSGWMVDRVKTFAEDMAASCSGQVWVLP
ncbi:hypothetical protein BJ170DRAFT_627203 [Xylariales sp. AK1849]|nr:hypothetical protein BJ170DRAFT_627203 [Xylariales sp. AK1849]